MTKKTTYRPAIYFITAYVITWVGGFILAYQSRQGMDKNILLLLIGYLGPYLSALIMLFGFGSKQLRRDFTRRIINLKLIKGKFLFFALIAFPVAMILAIFISILFGQPIQQLRFAEEFKVFNGEIIFSMIVLALVPILEELGWRGYGVDSLASRFNFFNTSWIFAFLWGAWHLPVFFIKGSYQASLWGQHPVYAINFFVGILPLVFIMNYLYYKNNRSVTLIVIFHIMVNYSSEIFSATQVSKCILTLVLTVLSIVLILKEKKFFFESRFITSEVEVNG